MALSYAITPITFSVSGPTTPDDWVSQNKGLYVFYRPLVSIVTPLYNQVDFIEETLQSVLTQTYGSIEYIVVNDGSTDGSRAIVEKYAGKIQVIDQENRGQACALNNGWSIANGKYISYLSSDDILLPDCVERLVRVLELRDDVVCAFPDCNLISRTSDVLKSSVSRPFDLEELLIGQECYIGPGALWRASAHRQIGGWRPDLKLAPDREYWMRLAPYGRFHFEAEPLASYRLHPGSISSSTTSETVSLEYIRVLEEQFSSKSIPPHIASRKNEAFANAYFLIARNMLREGNVRAAIRHLRHAYAAYPASFNPKNFLTLARSSVGKPLRQLAGLLQQVLRK